MAEKRFLDFLDRIDGGGAGQSGDRFEGGGLLSAIANALGSPYGSEDPERMAARQAFYGAQDIGGEPVPLAPQVMPNNPAVSPQARPFEPNYADRFAPPPFQRQPVVTHPVYTYDLDDPFEPNYTDRFAPPPPDPFSELMDRLLQQGIPTGNGPR